jgi:probable F420-dependent oxidoreductase
VVPVASVGFSINLFGTPLHDMVPLVTRAEELGFEAVWLGEHLIRPAQSPGSYPYSATGSAQEVWPEETELNDAWVVLGHLAAVTRRIRLATGVYVLPLRNPFVTARAVATVHALSSGRVMLGIGSGWYREEFETVGEDFDRRGRRMDEIIDILERLWSGETFSHAGEFYQFGEVGFGPAVTPSIPVMVGGDSKLALRRAALLGDGWYSTALGDLNQMAAARDTIEAMRAEAGRASLPFEYYVRIVGDLDAANAQRYRDAGFDHLTLATNRLWRSAEDLDEKIAILEHLASELEVEADPA